MTDFANFSFFINKIYFSGLFIYFFFSFFKNSLFLFNIILILRIT